MPRKKENAINLKELTKEIMKENGIERIHLEFENVGERIKCLKLDGISETRHIIKGEEIKHDVLEIKASTWDKLVLKLISFIYLKKLHNKASLVDLTHSLAQGHRGSDKALDKPVGLKMESYEGRGFTPLICLPTHCPIFVHYKKDIETLWILIHKLVRELGTKESYAKIYLDGNGTANEPENESTLPDESNASMTGEEIMKVEEDIHISKIQWYLEMEEITKYREGEKDIYSREYYACKCQLLSVFHKLEIFVMGHIALPEGVERKKYNRIYQAWPCWNKSAIVDRLYDKACFMHHILITDDVDITASDIRRENFFRDEIVKYYFVAFPINKKTLPELLKRYPALETDIIKAAKKMITDANDISKKPTQYYLITETKYMGKFY